MSCQKDLFFSNISNINGPYLSGLETIWIKAGVQIRKFLTVKQYATRGYQDNFLQNKILTVSIRNSL